MTLRHCMYVHQMLDVSFLSVVSATWPAWRYSSSMCGVHYADICLHGKYGMHDKKNRHAHAGLQVELTSATLPASTPRVEAQARKGAS